MHEFFVYGMSLADRSSRPQLILKDRDKELSLPVWLNALEMKMALGHRFSKETDSSPHQWSLDLLNKIGVRLSECHFVEIKGHHQYVELHFEPLEKLSPMRVRADQVMSICLLAKARFFASSSFVHNCRVIDQQQEDLRKNLLKHTDDFKKGQGYLM